MEKSDITLIEEFNNVSFPEFSRLLAENPIGMKHREIMLARQAVFNSLKAHLWETYAYHGSLGSQTLIKRLMDPIARSFRVSRLSYERIQKDQANSNVIAQWVDQENEGIYSIGLPTEIVHNRLSENRVIFSLDSPATSKKSRLFLKEMGYRSVLIVPFANEGDVKNSYFLFCECHEKREWNDFDFLILSELVRIVTHQSRQSLRAKNEHDMDSKLAIREKKEIEEELRSSRKTLRLVIDNIPQFIYWKDRNSVYQGCNRNFSKAAGFSSPKDIIGKTDDELGWQKDQVESYVCSDRRVMDSNTPEFHIIEEQIRADGSKTWLDTSKIPLRNWDGEVIGILGSYDDITEDLIAQKKEKEKEQQLLQADKMISLGILASGVAHEINNPNQFIMSNLPPLKKALEESQPILEKYCEEYGDFRIGGLNYSEVRDRLPVLFNNIMEGSQRIKNIVKELREYIKGYPAEHSETIRFNSVVHSALTLLSNLIGKSTNAFFVDYGRNMPVITGHYQRLEQVVINLVQNACQALTCKEEKISIATRFNEGERSVLLTVSDEGVGIPEDQLDRVTDLFFTTKREIGGIGLGLAISSKIVIEHGGKLIFTPSIKKGTVVTMSLPVR